MANTVGSYLLKTQNDPVETSRKIREIVDLNHYYTPDPFEKGLRYSPHLLEEAMSARRSAGVKKLPSVGLFVR